MAVVLTLDIAIKPNEDGDGFEAWIPHMRSSIKGKGETRPDALADLLKAWSDNLAPWDYLLGVIPTLPTFEV